MANFAIKYQDENSASGALAELLRRSRLALDTFWQLTRPTPAAKLPKEVAVDHLHPTDQGREIDILIHAGQLGVIVECKVNDEKKPYQFSAYASYWRRTRQADARLVWLVQRNRRILGDDDFDVATLTWLQLRKALHAAAAKGSVVEGEMIASFCTALMKAGIGLPDTAAERPRKKAVGYDHEHASSILSGILESSVGVSGGALAQNALNPALHVGRTEWSEPLDDIWVRRVWLYFTPLSAIANTKGPYHFHGQVLLYHAGFGNKHSRALHRVAEWGDQFRRLGFRMLKNAPGTWNRNQPLLPREGVYRGIKHVFAEESLQIARSIRFDWRSDQAAIAAGAKQLMGLVRAFDQVLDTPRNPINFVD